MALYIVYIYTFRNFSQKNIPENGVYKMPTNLSTSQYATAFGTMLNNCFKVLSHFQNINFPI